MEPYNQCHLKLLRQRIANTSNITVNGTADCIKIKDDIYRHGYLFISLITLERLYGFKESRFPPSRYTVDTLSRYCGFNDWAAFCAAFPLKDHNYC
jgi:hypothetical protein